MTKEGADKIAITIFEKTSEKVHAAYEQLRKHGWKSQTLDGGTPPEVKAIENECRRKIKELAAQIDE